jgi:hypothetical protein
MGKCLAWDVTSPDTLAPSHLSATSIEAGAAAEAMDRSKNIKYEDISRSHRFIVLALESLGPINREGQLFIASLGRRLTLASGDPRETGFLFQRLSVINQRCNAISFAGTFSDIETNVNAR